MPNVNDVYLNNYYVLDYGLMCKNNPKWGLVLFMSSPDAHLICQTGRREEGNRVDKGQKMTTDQQLTRQGYICKSKDCIGGEWGIPPPCGAWWQWISWQIWQGGGRQEQTTLAAAVRQQSTKSDGGKQWH
jgi:hypothetical protein